jgi:hypothetical protein
MGRASPYTHDELALLRALAAAHTTSRPVMAATAGAGSAGDDNVGRLHGLRLALMDTAEVRAMSVVEVKVPSTFTRNLPTPGGVNDLLMGSTDRQFRCATCKGACDGHNGHIELACPILRMSYVKATIAHLRTCCRVCGRKKWQSHGEGDAAMAAAGVARTCKRSPFVNAAHIFAKTPAVGHERIRALADACKNRLWCPWTFDVRLPDGSVIPACGAPQPTYRQSKDNRLLILHSYGDKQLAGMKDPEERLWALGRLHPAEIRSIIASTPVLTLAEMGYRLDPSSVVPARDGSITPRLLSHPKNFVMEVQLVLPNSVRPSIHLTDGSRCRGEDDLTRAYVNIVRQNLDLAKAKAAFHAARAAAEASHTTALRRARKQRDAVAAAYDVAVAEHAATQELLDGADHAARGSEHAAHCFEHAARGAEHAARSLPASDASDEEEEAHAPTRLDSAGRAARAKGGAHVKGGAHDNAPAIMADMAAAALARAEAALTKADGDLASVLLAIDAACHKERTAFYIAWDKLAVECAALITPTIRNAVKIEGVKEHRHGRASRRKQQGLKERLTGKKGRMRGNNLGRRVDQSARSVVGPDASHNIWELGVPSVIMNTLTFPSRVTSLNIRQLQLRVQRGAAVNDGAVNVLRPDTTGAQTIISLSLLDDAGRADLAAQLQVGWIVERMMQDGDWVLFNRQPSLHKASMMAFRVYRVKCLAFKLPLPCTAPFNAGLCMPALQCARVCLSWVCITIRHTTWCAWLADFGKCHLSRVHAWFRERGGSRPPE